MIDEKKLIEDIEKEIEFSMKCNMPAMVAGMRQIASIIENQPKIGEWIPCSEQLPEDGYGQTFLLTVKDGKETIVTFAKYQPKYRRFNLTGARSYWKPVAWMPLPEPYNPGMIRKQTNADRIRNMDDEELAELLYSLQYCDEKLNFCGNNKECDDILDGGGTVTDEMCKQCLFWWLQSEVEE